jgi:hypothetical protein
MQTCEISQAPAKTIGDCAKTIGNCTKVICDYFPFKNDTKQDCGKIIHNCGKTIHDYFFILRLSLP